MFQIVKQMLILEKDNLSNYEKLFNYYYYLIY